MTYEKYIKLIRNIFNNVISKILPLIFNYFFENRNNKIYNIDNLSQYFDEKNYELLKEKYEVTDNDKLIFRFRRYHRLDYIINLLKEKEIILKDGETYKLIAQKILETPNIKNYSKYVDEEFICKNKNIYFVK